MSSPMAVEAALPETPLLELFRAEARAPAVGSTREVVVRVALGPGEAPPV